MESDAACWEMAPPSGESPTNASCEKGAPRRQTVDVKAYLHWRIESFAHWLGWSETTVGGNVKSVKLAIHCLQYASMFCFFVFFLISLKKDILKLLFCHLSAFFFSFEYRLLVLSIYCYYRDLRSTPHTPNARYNLFYLIWCQSLSVHYVYI